MADDPRASVVGIVGFWTVGVLLVVFAATSSAPFLIGFSNLELHGVFDKRDTFSICQLALCITILCPSPLVHIHASSTTQKCVCWPLEAPQSAVFDATDLRHPPTAAILQPGHWENHGHDDRSSLLALTSRQMNPTECEILVHVTAPSGARDDKRYVSIAQAVLDFEPVSKVKVSETNFILTSPASGAAQNPVDSRLGPYSTTRYESSRPERVDKGMQHLWSRLWA